MEDIIVGTGMNARQQKIAFWKKRAASHMHAIASFGRTTKIALIILFVVVISGLVVGGKQVINYLPAQLSSMATGATTYPSNTKATHSTDSSATSSTQTNSTVGTGTMGTGSAQPILPTFGTPPALGSVYHNVFFVGDSITAGWINDGAHAYPILTIGGLYSHNTGNGWYQLVKGRSGAVSAGALLDLQTFQVQPKNSNLVVVELGTNDMVHMSAAKFQSDYQALLAYLATGSPNAQYVCLGPWRAATDNFGHDSTPAYEAAIQNVCKGSTNNTALYVNLSSLYANKAYHNTTGDTFHPNNTGAQAIANAIVSAVYP